MRKIFALLIAIIFIAGCGNMMNTPTKKVEEFLSKYQTMDEKVLSQLDDVMKSAGTMTSDQKNKYRDLMKKQYQNLSYKIKDETEDGDTATVEVEIEVYDYATSITESETYLVTNRDEFVDKETQIVNDEKYMDYKLEQLAKVKDKVTYTINFTLTKEDDKWKLDDITEIDRQKIHGLYS
ncbi:MAG: hypothetical protein PUB18_04605 [bacterium]|nr:hypothetical protein [bacterium]